MNEAWKQVIDETLVSRWIGVYDENDSYEDAKKKLDKLLEFEVAVATDPRVNGGYELRYVGGNDE